MKMHGYKKDGIASHLSETLCGWWIHNDFVTKDNDKITCKWCIRKLL
jgi:hypothetical protein